MARSKRHLELQNMVYKWIYNRSFKMYGIPEFKGVGYLADFFAIAGMHSEHHSRYAKYSGLTKMTMSRRLKDDHKNRIAGDKWERYISGDIDRWFACVFEVKVSRADFLNTFGNRESNHSKARKEPVGTAHWVVAEKGICKPEELPVFWGLLEPYGAGLTEKKMPKLNIVPENILHAFAFDLLWLQMNYRVSYYDQMIDMAKTVRFVHDGILKDKPKGELLRRSSQAIEACRGCAL